jgi:hypothetical protein
VPAELLDVERLFLGELEPLGKSGVGADQLGPLEVGKERSVEIVGTGLRDAVDQSSRKTALADVERAR